jgi:hypothetical protein
MSAEHRRYLVLEQGVGSAVFNFLLNGAIAWLLFRGLETVPLWGQQSIAGDTIATCILLPLLTCLVVTHLARGQVRTGRIVPLGWTRSSHPALGWLPHGTFARGVVLATLGVAVLAPAALLVLQALGVAAMPFWSFVLFKASFAAGAAALMTPVAALWAIAEPLAAPAR